MKQEWNKYEKELNKLSSNIYSPSDIFKLKDSEGNSTKLGKLNDELDTIQNAYSTLSDIVKSYDESGLISIDQLQSLIALGDNFLDYLVDEEGNLKTDAAAMEQLASARLYEMKIKIQQGIIDNVMGIKSEADATKYLASTNYALANSIHEVAREDLARWKADAIVNRDISAEKADEVYNKSIADFDNT